MMHQTCNVSIPTGGISVQETLCWMRYHSIRYEV